MLPEIITRVFRNLMAIAMFGGLNVAAAADAGEVYPLTSVEGLSLNHVVARSATHQGRAGLRVAMAEDLQARIVAMSDQERQQLSDRGEFPEQLALIDGPEFGDGILEIEVAGEAQTGVFKDARGFVGLAFRVQKDLKTYDAFYLRPTNGRAEEQVRRNRAVQYISHPDWTWQRLRKESPGKYESYVDLVPGEWTRLRIEVRGDKAKLYVHDSAQPVLIVNDLKTGSIARGAIALWLGTGTVAHFRNLQVRPLPAQR